MNWKDLRLGAKLGVGFGILLLIALLLGGLAIINMWNISKQSQLLSEEFIPEVEISNQIERSTFEMMYALRRYNLTLETESYNEAQRHLTHVQTALQKATDLAQKSTALVQLQSSIDQINQDMTQYKNLIEQAKQENDKLLKVYDTMDNAAAKFMNSAYAYLDNQNSRMENEITGGGANLERHKKITLINNIIDLGNQTRVNNFKAQARRQDDLAKNAMTNFDKIKQKLDEIRQYTRLQTDLAELDKLQQAANSYKESMDAMLDEKETINQIAQQRRQKGEDILTRVQETAAAGMLQTVEISDGAIKTIQASNSIMIIGLLVALLLGIFMAYVITRAITVPIGKGVEFAQKISNGDLTATVEVEQNDEIGKLAVALRQMAKKMSEIVGHIIAGADNIAAASIQLSSSSQQMSQGATEQASSAEEVSSSMEQMAANIQQNTDNAQQTEKIANKAAGDMQEGSQNVNQTVESMKTIADKISIINDIAFQTNILALNAAVEAARAGEHGKGFAVVAAEVRKLAERSQIAANEIDNLSNSSVDIALKSGKLLEEIVPGIQHTSKLVQEIAAASIEQNSGANQVNNAIQQLNQVIQQNAAASEEMATSSEELSSQAEQLKDIISFFKIKDNYRQKNKTQNFSSLKTKQHANKTPDHSKQAANKTDDNTVANQTNESNGIKLDLSDSDSEYEQF